MSTDAKRKACQASLEFKVGDTVRVKTELKDYYMGPKCEWLANKMVGELGEVQAVDPRRGILVLFSEGDLEEEASYYYPPHALERVKTKKPPEGLKDLGVPYDAVKHWEPVTTPKVGSRWCRSGYDKSKGPYNGYTVRAITNTTHAHPRHQPMVVYQGDNGHWWSLAVDLWPGSLVPED